MVTFILLLQFLSIGIFFAPSKYKSSLAALIVVVNAIVTSWIALPAMLGTPVELLVYAGSFIGNVTIRVDGLSAWFIFIINFTSITGAFYGSGYLKTHSEKSSKLNLHWVMFTLFHMSMVWVCMLQNSFAFLIAWEIMSLSSMLLIIFDHNNSKTLKAGINYMVQMHISVVFLTVGFLWVYFETGSFDFNSLNNFFGTHSNIWLFLIFFVGFGLKAGFIPLHTWLPHAHPAAPSHISGVMSGVIVKLGIYGIIRIASFLQTDFLILGEIVVTISVLTGLYGILNAAVHGDFKRMLAYCTIENIGIIGIGIGIGLMGIGNGMPLMYYLGFGGALLHVLNHSLFKSLLFYSAGSIYLQTHTRDMDKLGGLIKLMPKTAILFLIGSIAIGGIPPFNGFISEFILYSGLIEGIKSNDLAQTSLLILSLAGLSIIGGLSILTFTKTFGTIFLGSPRQTLKSEPKEVSKTMLIPQYIIVAVMLSIVFIPKFYLNIIGNLLSSLGNVSAGLAITEFTSYASTISYISLSTACLIGLVGFIWIIRRLVTSNLPSIKNATWGCGYVAPNTRMQYSGKSYSKTLGKIFSFFLIEGKNYKELRFGEILPNDRSYSSYYHDFFEFRFIKRFSKQLVNATSLFKFIQNGRTQSYVLYGIVFILAILIITVLNVI